MRSNVPGFKVYWHEGARAQLEISSNPTGTQGTNKYGLKYTPPIRAALRPPIQEPALGQQELDSIKQGLDSLVTSLQSSASRQASTELVSTQEARVSEHAEDTPTQQMENLGWQLSRLLFPQNSYMSTDLRKDGFFLEIGTDEELQGYPWELMSVGDDFICLKHYIGRYINASTPPDYESRQMDLNAKELSILIISVPRPYPRSPTEPTYENLPEAEAETNAILETLDKIDGVKPHLLIKNEATFDNVLKALRNNEYQIIHFNGHATYSNTDISRSKLVLQDRDINARQVTSFLSNPPILCFINACETARTGQPVSNSLTWQTSYDMFGMAHAFLKQGSYFLGSRWKLGDEAAAAFATEFYTSLIKNDKPLGIAISSARRSCKSKSDDQFSWASYVFYGDPRVGFKREYAEQAMNNRVND